MHVMIEIIKIKLWQHSFKNIVILYLPVIELISKRSFIFTGIIYDVIVEPPSIGSTTDERGNSKPVRKIHPLILF